MAALPASGGVRSLLAKFENTNNNNNNNPEVSPSRGRHSGDSQDNAPNRPLSKVRASFVSVERNGQGSPTPGALRRTESYNTDVDSNHRSATVSPTGQLETALASPFSTSPHKIRTALAAFQGDRVETVNAKLASLAVKDNVQPLKVTEKLETTPQLLQPAIIEKPTEKPTNTTSTKQTAPPKTIKKSASTMSIVKESSANKNPIRAATVKERKPAVTPTRSATTTTRPTAHSDKHTGNRTTAVKSSAPVARAQRASTPSHDVPKRPTVQPSPKTKPASKSPTRPVRLPASLVTPTAASAARTGTLARSQSHVNLRSSPKAEPAKTLSRKPSTLRPDTSRLGTHTIPDRPRSRVSTTSSRAPQEESFLARMMRPTASSASKMHDKVEPRSPPRLAVAVKLTPKKETPTKTAEDKKEKHEKTSQDSTPAIPQAKIERVATGQAAIKKDAAFENCHHVEPPALAKEESQKEAEVSTAEPSSDPIVTEPAVISAAELASELVVEDPKPEATAAQSSTEPKAIEEVVEEPQTQAIQASDADAINEKSLASVPETVPEEPESDVKEAALEATSETDPLHDNQQDSITEPVLEASVPQEEISNKTEEITEDQDKLAEPEQSTEESVQHATEETPAEPAKKAEESLQSASTDESLEPTTEKTEKEVEPTLEGDN